MQPKRVWIIDTETTGTNPAEDKTVEVAGVLVEGCEIVKTYESFVNPGIPIPPEASAVHHITDDMVKNAPTLDAALMPILEEDFDYAGAHNANFDSAFCPLGDTVWLCTWKIANRLWPDAPSFGNQVLRYWRGVEGPSSTTHAHRALYDAEVTARLFIEMLKSSTVDDPYEAMAQISSRPILLRKVNFGKHLGKLWSEVPKDYLNFILNKSSGWDENVLHTARRYYDS